jgi:hypothetical protein
MLANLLVSASDIIDADDAALARDVILGSIKKPPVLRETAVTVVVAPCASGEDVRRRIPADFERDRKRPGPPREYDDAPRETMIGDVVSPCRKRNLPNDRAIGLQQKDAEISAAPPRRRDIGDGLMRSRRKNLSDGARTDERQRTEKQRSAINRHRVH